MTCLRLPTSHHAHMGHHGLSSALLSPSRRSAGRSVASYSPSDPATQLRSPLGSGKHPTHSPPPDKVTAGWEVTGNTPNSRWQNLGSSSTSSLLPFWVLLGADPCAEKAKEHLRSFQHHQVEEFRAGPPNPAGWRAEGGVKLKG